MILIIDRRSFYGKVFCILQVDASAAVPDFAPNIRSMLDGVVKNARPYGVVGEENIKHRYMNSGLTKSK